MKSPLTNVLLLPLNIFSTYYFQSLMKPGASFLVSVVRGLVLSGLLIYALPLLLGANAIWLAMPITEAAVAFLVVFLQIYEGAVRREGVGLTLRLAYGIIDETGGTGRTA